MSAPKQLPDSLDAWRMIAARRRIEGSLSPTDLPRLRESLAGDAGEIRYVLEFDKDEGGQAVLKVGIEATLALQCQRSLEVFDWSVQQTSALGLVTNEEQEAALHENLEPFLLNADGMLDPALVIEEELFLALPVLPVKPGQESDEEMTWTAHPPGQAKFVEEPKVSPFEALKQLKKQ